MINLNPKKNHRISDLVCADFGEKYAAFREAAAGVLAVTQKCVGINPNAPIFYHADAIRATTLLLQGLLRNDALERFQRDETINSCRIGIDLCRALVPNFLARVEDTLQRLLNE